MSKKSNIHILNEYTAKQIAAGEVIERPACVVRELIDNSIDAHAQTIEIQLISGGLNSICVSDDGRGMGAEDLRLCCCSHATSKIQSADDLLALHSMGFRGEALASISAISKTSIVSFDSEEQRAHEIVVEGNEVSQVRDAVHNKGTRICVENLFHTIPVRKKFLSSISAERTRVKNTLLDKAAAFPHIAFTLKEGMETIVRMPREEAFARAVRITTHVDGRMFVWHEEERNTEGYGALKLQAALGLPDIATRTRKHMHLYVNNRPVRSFQITQAVEYAYKDILHTGSFPQAVVFLHIVPSEVDVNVHPSKQEIRIKPMPHVRSLIIQAISNALEKQTRALPQYKDTLSTHDSIKPPLFVRDKVAEPSTRTPVNSPHTKPSTYTYRHISPRSFTTTAQPTSTIPVTAPALEVLCEPDVAYKAEAPHFIGCAFASYVVFEQGDALLFLDFHATHERQLFDNLLRNPNPQALVVPIPLSLDMAKEDRDLAIQAYKRIGIGIKTQKKNDEVHYSLCEVPQVLYTRSSALASLIDETDYAAEGVNVELFARKACKGAVKAGDHIDSHNAHALLKYAQTLNRPRCPHGRPLWVNIAKATLDSMIGRKP